MLHTRVIGTYQQAEKGPLVFVLGGLHGNEPAGTHALELLFKMLEVEPITNPLFSFRGRLVGLRGNINALESKKRFISRDLNRIWSWENLNEALNTDPDELDSEGREMADIWGVFQHEIETFQPEEVIILDLHTTSSSGGIFTLVSEEKRSLDIGLELHGPVIRGMMAGLTGTTMHFFNDENLGIPTTSIVFESGQHNENLSINRAIAAIINCLRTVGCIDGKYVENVHDELLLEFSKNLPDVSELQYCHSITEHDGFRMFPGFKNFQPIKKGDLLGVDNHGDVRAQSQGMILMPLYQSQGDDGYFIVRKSVMFKESTSVKKTYEGQRAKSN